MIDRGEFVVFEGEMIEFDYDDRRDRARPVLKNNDTGEQIIFRIRDSGNRMEIGSTYQVVYLSNTNRAEIIERK